jgi:hypothetical protein
MQVAVRICTQLVLHGFGTDIRSSQHRGLVHRHPWLSAEVCRCSCQISVLRHLPCKASTLAKSDSHSSTPKANFQTLHSRNASPGTEDDGEPIISANNSKWEGLSQSGYLCLSRQTDRPRDTRPPRRGTVGILFCFKRITQTSLSYRRQKAALKRTFAALPMP